MVDKHTGTIQLSLETLKAHRDSLLTFTEAHYASAVVLFIGTYTLITGLSLPGAAIMTLAGGFLFGITAVPGAHVQIARLVLYLRADLKGRAPVDRAHIYRP